MIGTEHHNEPELSIPVGWSVLPLCEAKGPTVFEFTRLMVQYVALVHDRCMYIVQCTRGATKKRCEGGAEPESMDFVFRFHHLVSLPMLRLSKPHLFLS